MSDLFGIYDPNKLTLVAMCSVVALALVSGIAAALVVKHRVNDTGKTRDDRRPDPFFDRS